MTHACVSEHGHYRFKYSRGVYTARSQCLTHWGRETHICVSKLTIIASDNGLSPGRRQAIICTNAGILLIGPLWTNFSEILIGIQTFSFKKRHMKMSSAKRRPFCLGLNVLTNANILSIRRQGTFVVNKIHYVARLRLLRLILPYLTKSVP